MVASEYREYIIGLDTTENSCWRYKAFVSIVAGDARVHEHPEYLVDTGRSRN